QIKADRANPEQYRNRLETTTIRLQQVTADLDRAVSERDRLRSRVAELEQRHSQLDIGRQQKGSGFYRLAGLIPIGPDQPQAEPLGNDTLISDAPPEVEERSRGVTQFAHQAVAEVRRLLASTGLNVDRLFPQLGQDHGLGGPFVVPPKGGQPNG